ncbi:MAG: hypothetical protein M1825_006404 [Sarcosagium campestre]|nr:MAG: hypothetical protein M1825_006404 [Sarcosagium campestre]
MPARKTPAAAPARSSAPPTTTKSSFRQVAFSLTDTTAPYPLVSVPRPLRFPLLVLSSLLISSVGYTLTAPYTARDLGGISRSLNEWWEVGGLIGWRAVELGLGWWLNYDGIDLAALILLSHTPTLHLLSSFYNISPRTVLVSVTLDIVAAYVPFRLLRPLSWTHKRAGTPHRGAQAGLSTSVVRDVQLAPLTTILASAIYAVVVYASLQSWLPRFLVLHFTGLRDISPAYDSALPTLLLYFLPLGYAAKEFIFTPAVAAVATQPTAVTFDPETATLTETLWWNAWGYSKRSKTLIKRTATLTVVTALNTWLHTYVTVDGVESFGAQGWGALWASAAALTGIVFWWVGDV